MTGGFWHSQKDDAFKFQFIVLQKVSDIVTDDSYFLCGL